MPNGRVRVWYAVLPVRCWVVFQRAKEMPPLNMRAVGERLSEIGCITRAAPWRRL